MRKPLVIAAAVIGVLLLVGLILIGPATPSSGMIHDKRHTAGQFDTDCKKVSGKTKCTTEWENEICEFFLREGKRMGWTEVPCGTYHDMAVGQYYRGW